MDTVLGLLGWAIIIWAVSAWRRARRDRRPSPTVRPRPRTAAPSRARRTPETDETGPIAGWMIGHQIAHGHHGFPGDPLPGGHLGSPADLAFWGGMFADENDDDEGEEQDG